MTLTELNEIKQNYKVLELAVDFINPSYNISRAKHLDTARYIVCTLTENGIPRTVKANEAVRIRLQKPDRTYIYNDCNVLEDGRVFITLTEQILAVEGNAVCDIQLTDEETGIIYSTKNFIINIDKTAVNNSIMESTNEFGALNNLIATNKKLNDELKENEDARQANENTRIENETDRQTAEFERVNSENTRIINENQRVANENTRQANEVIRQTQETDRETNTANAISNAEKATQKANNAADDLENKLNSHHFILSEDKGVANGVAELDSNGLIPSNQLPSYVDDVIEGYLHSDNFYKEAEHITKITGESGKIYVDLTTNKTYRWSGSAFAIISETIALGETSSTAYRGDRGKIAYDHSQAVHAPADAEVNQNAFSNVAVGSTAISADSKTDTLTLEAGDNITLTPDVANSKITISSTGSGGNGNYLPLTGGVMTGQIEKAIVSSAWYNGRDRAALRLHSGSTEISNNNIYIPAVSIKSNLGSWETGVFSSPTNLKNEYFKISLISDTDYSSNNNKVTSHWLFYGNGQLYSKKFQTFHEAESSWSHARDTAPILISNWGNMYSGERRPVLSTKVLGGSWEIVTLLNSSLDSSRLYFSLVDDNDYSNNTGNRHGYVFIQGDSSIHATKFVGALEGNASTATKLTSSVGSDTTPVYFDNGIPKACTYSLNKSVPADAKFTDTTYVSFTGATTGADGKAGLVPTPSKKTSNTDYKLLRDDGNWCPLYGAYTDNSYAHPASTACVYGVYSTLKPSINKKIGLGSSGTITGSKTLSVVPGDIVIITGYGSGGSTYIFSIYDATHFMVNGGTNGSNIYSSFTPSASLGTLASMTSGVLTLTKLSPWSACYYNHLHIG